MNIDFITDPEMQPRPRGEIRIENLEITPYGDGTRFRIAIEITPFAPPDRPSIEVVAFDSEKSPRGHIDIIDAVNRTLEVTMHLRGNPITSGNMTFASRLYYDPEETHHTRTEHISIS